MENTSKHSISDLTKENIVIEGAARNGEDSPEILVNYRKLTSIQFKKKNNYGYIEENSKISISLIEVSDNYQIITSPLSNNIPLTEFSNLEWKILPLLTKFDLIFKVQICKINVVSSSDHTYHPTDEFSILARCKAKKPYMWKWIRWNLFKHSNLFIPFISGVALTLLAWWLNGFRK